MKLTDRFGEALMFAEKLHRAQTRKGNDIPYVAHLLAAAATVLEHGGDEDTAIAALLHDAVEDQGGLKTRDAIEARFGQRVAALVMACTDSVDVDPAAKEPWEQRKRRHIEKLRSVNREVALITIGDKLHNLNAMIRDVERDGRDSLDRFNAPGQLVWYFESIADALEAHAETAPIAELRERVRTLERLILSA